VRDADDAGARWLFDDECARTLLPPPQPYTRRALVGRTYRRLGLVIQGRRMSDDVVSQLVGALNTGTGGGLVLQRFKITAN